MPISHDRIASGCPTDIVRATPLNILILSSETHTKGYGSATALHTFIEAAIKYSNWNITLVVPSSHSLSLEYPPSRVQVIPVHTPLLRSRLVECIAFGVAAPVTLRSLSESKLDVAISWQPLPGGVMGWLAS